ncbi:MAG: hypothetical protein V3T08_09485 [Gemmatimonadota bacterium]
MQSPRADVLNPFLKAELLSTGLDLLDDAQIGTSIVLKSLSSQTVDLEAGTVARASIDDTVNALRRTVEVAEAEQSGGKLQVGDRVYLIEQSDLAGELQAVDQIVDGDDVFEVVRWEEDPLGWFYSVTARQS